MADVTAIVPVYNSAPYLRRCLDSLVAQTLGSFQMVLVDDGSTDASPAILEEYRQKYPGKIKIITKANGGQGSARNLGIRQSDGTFIGFVDSDDYVAPDMYEVLHSKAVASGSNFVECLYRGMEEKPRGVKEWPVRGHVRAYESNKDMFIDCQVSPCTKLFHRDILLEPGVTFPEGLIYEDTAFFIKAIPFIKKSSFVNKALYSYVLRGGSTMAGNRGRRVGDIFPVLDDILAFFRERGFYGMYERELEYFCVKILFCSSLSRVGRVADRALKRELLDRTFAWVNANFPNYQKNPYLDGKMVGRYIRHIRRGIAAPLAWAFARVIQG